MPPKANDGISNGERDGSNSVQRLTASPVCRKFQVQSLTATLKKVLEKGIYRNKYPTKNSKQNQNQKHVQSNKSQQSIQNPNPGSQSIRESLPEEGGLCLLMKGQQRWGKSGFQWEGVPKAWGIFETQLHV